jgi:prolyl oligopeptidase
MTLELDDGTVLQGAVEAETFFTSSYWWFPEGETAPVRWPIPMKSSPEGIYRGQFLVSLQEDWTPEGQAGSVQIRRSRCLRCSRVYGDPGAADGLPRLPAFRMRRRWKASAIAKDAHAAVSVSDTAVGKVMRRLSRTAMAGKPGASRCRARARPALPLPIHTKRPSS